jgi:hypothetical protein
VAGRNARLVVLLTDDEMHDLRDFCSHRSQSMGAVVQAALRGHIARGVAIMKPTSPAAERLLAKYKQEEIK